MKKYQAMGLKLLLKDREVLAGNYKLMDKENICL